MPAHAAHRARPAASGPAAFTLVELLVVIAIVAALLSLLAPSLARSREAARAAVCLGQLRTIGQAVALYADASGDHYPLSSHTTGSLAAPGGWLVALEDFGAPPSVRRCPSDRAAPLKLTSYATNDHFEPLAPGLDFDPFTGATLPGGRRRAATRTVLVPRPATTLYAVEPRGDATVDHLHSVGWSHAGQVRDAVDVERHAGAFNALFADTHAAPVPWAPLRDAFSVARNPFNPEAAP